MPDPAGRAHVALDADPRLLAGLSGAVEHFAQMTGFDPAGCADLMDAVETTCRETFPLASAGTVDVLLSSYPDRVEIAVEHRGEAQPAAGLDTFLGGAGVPAGAGLALLNRVDRILYNTEGGVSRTTLIKRRK
jgi:hypothetical protein